MAVEINKMAVRLFRDVKRNTMTGYVQINDIQEEIRFGFRDVIDENVSEHAHTKDSKIKLNNIRMRVDYTQDGVYDVKVEMLDLGKVVTFHTSLDTTKDGLILEEVWERSINFDQWLERQSTSKLQLMLRKAKEI